MNIAEKMIQLVKGNILDVTSGTDGHFYFKLDKEKILYSRTRNGEYKEATDLLIYLILLSEKHSCKVDSDITYSLPFAEAMDALFEKGKTIASEVGFGASNYTYHLNSFSILVDGIGEPANITREEYESMWRIVE